MLRSGLPAWMKKTKTAFPIFQRWILYRRARKSPDWEKTLYAARRPAFVSLLQALSRVMEKQYPHSVGPTEIFYQVKRVLQVGEKYPLVIAVWLQNHRKRRFYEIHFPLRPGREVWIAEYELHTNLETGESWRDYIPVILPSARKLYEFLHNELDELEKKQD